MSFCRWHGTTSSYRFPRWNNTTFNIRTIIRFGTFIGCQTHLAFKERRRPYMSICRTQTRESNTAGKTIVACTHPKHGKVVG